MLEWLTSGIANIDCGKLEVGKHRQGGSDGLLGRITPRYIIGPSETDHYLVCASTCRLNTTVHVAVSGCMHKEQRWVGILWKLLMRAELVWWHSMYAKSQST